MKLDFIRGHMGGNVIILLYGDQLPTGQELEFTARIMGPNYLYAHDAGLLYPGNTSGHVRLRMVEPNVPGFITACGGLSQVLGLALMETSLGKDFGINPIEGQNPVVLDTDCGPTLLEIENIPGKGVSTRTHLDAYLRECYDRGVENLTCAGFPVVRVGKFLVIQREEVEKFQPELDFIRWTSVTREKLGEIQDDFMEQTGETEPSVVVYDWKPDKFGHGRVVFPHAIRQNFIEPSCGTGTVAMALAALHRGAHPENIGNRQKTLEYRMESGGGIGLGGPDISQVEVQIEDDRAASVIFSHNNVQITSLGKVII